MAEIQTKRINGDYAVELSARSKTTEFGKFDRDTADTITRRIKEAYAEYRSLGVKIKGADVVTPDGLAFTWPSGVPIESVWAPGLTREGLIAIATHLQDAVDNEPLSI
jgi:hypothetical protein